MTSDASDTSDTTDPAAVVLTPREVAELRRAFDLRDSNDPAGSRMLLISEVRGLIEGLPLSLAEEAVRVATKPLGYRLLSLTTDRALERGAEGGTLHRAVLSAHPSFPFRPYGLFAAQGQRPTSLGGTRDLILTSLFIGTDDQMRFLAPGGQSGITLGALERLPLLLDAAYPAIGITAGLENPTHHRTEGSVVLHLLGKQIVVETW